MSKFNKTTNTKEKNLANGTGFKRTDLKKEVTSVILNSMLSGNSAYETEKERISKIEKLVKNRGLDNEFLAKAMVYVRNEGNLRSVSHLMAVLLAENVKGETFMKNALYKTMIRPDDATEMIALWNSRNEGKMIPNALRKSVKSALEAKWDRYQLKKYYGNGPVKVSNLINLTHPKPSNEDKEEMFKQALEKTLPNIDTAQTVNADKTGKARAKKYLKMLKDKKLGYMGLMKNLKNILEAYSELKEEKKEELITEICNLLENEKACLNSRVLPFRFVQAYFMLEDIMDTERNDTTRVKTVSDIKTYETRIKKVLKSVEKGFKISAKNINIVEENESIALLLDESGSMNGMYWSGSNEEKLTTPFWIGKILMASMLTGLDKNKTLGYLWADNAREINIDGSPMKFIKNTNTRGGGTDVWAALSELIRNKIKVDKLVIFTDMQMYNSWLSRGGDTFVDMVKKYRKINPKVKVLFWNLEGYGGPTPIKLDHDILEVSGYSDKMLEVIPKIWKDKDALIKEIEKVEL